MSHEDDDRVFDATTGEEISRDGNIIPFPRSRKPVPADGLNIKVGPGVSLDDIDRVAEAEQEALKRRFGPNDDI